MADIIYVNHERVEEDAARVESAAAYLRSVLLAPQDTRTTLFVRRHMKDLRTGFLSWGFCWIRSRRISGT